MIEKKEVYVTCGKTFSTLSGAEGHRRDMIGIFMDSAPILLSPGQRIKLNDFMTEKENREKLIQLLDY